MGGAASDNESKRDDVDGEQEAFPTPTPAITPAASLGFAPTPAVELPSDQPTGEAQPMLAPAELELDPEEIFGQIEDIGPEADEQLKRPRVEAEDDAALLPQKKTRLEDNEGSLGQRE